MLGRYIASRLVRPLYSAACSCSAAAYTVGVRLYSVGPLIQCGGRLDSGSRLYSMAAYTVQPLIQCGRLYSAAAHTVRPLIQCSRYTVRPLIQCSRSYSAAAYIV